MGWLDPRGPGLYQAGFVGDDHELAAVTDAEFGEQPADVCLGGAFAHVGRLAARQPR
jgi:hypothetical protein